MQRKKSKEIHKLFFRIFHCFCFQYQNNVVLYHFEQLFYGKYLCNPLVR